jgi:hypothetical protein
MVNLHSLMTFLNTFPGDVGDKDPHTPNGLQVRRAMLIEKGC